MEDNWDFETIDGAQCFARISAVNPASRTCSIVTYGSDKRVAGGVYDDVQWLSVYSSPMGQEISFVPDVNCRCVVAFVGETPWIVGFLNAITIDDETEVLTKGIEGQKEKTSASAGDRKEKINKNDFIMRGVSGNRILVRAGGEIEVESTPLCRRVFFPNRNLITELCQNFEFDTDGGSIDWVHTETGSDFTTFRQEWRSDINRTNIVIEEKGTIEGDLISRYQMGAATDFSLNSEHTPRIKELVRIDGTREYYLRQSDPSDSTFAFQTIIGTTGEYLKGVGDFSYYKNILPSGQTTVNIMDTFQKSILPTGEVQVDVGIEGVKSEGLPGEGGVGKFSLNVKPTGETSLNINKKLDLSLKDSGAISLDVNKKLTLDISEDGKTELDINKKLNLTLSADEGVKIDYGPGQAVFMIDPTGTLTVQSATAAQINAPVIALNGAVSMGGAPAPAGGGSGSGGDAAEQSGVPVGTKLLEKLNKFIQEYNTHTHVVISPGDPTKVPLKPAKEFDDSFVSEKVKVAE